MSIFNSIPVVGKLIAENPWLKWAVIAFVAIFAVEFLGERAVDLYAKLGTVKETTEATRRRATAGGVGDVLAVDRVLKEREAARCQSSKGGISSVTGRCDDAN